MQERLKEIRKLLNLNQSEFAEKLNLSRGQIACYETGRRSVSTRTINDICREFDINKEWLITGEGDIFIENVVFSLDKYAKENNMTELEVEIFKRFLGLDVETRTKVMEFMSTTFGNKTTSSASETAPQNLEKRNLDDTEFATVEEAEEAYKKSRLNSASKMTSSVTSSTNDSVNLKVVK